MREPSKTLFEATLPLPPTANNLFVNVPRRGRVPSKQYTAWRNLIAPTMFGVKPITSFPVCVHIVVVGGKGWRKNSDIANREKAVTDALVIAGIIPDDSSEYVRRVVIDFEEPKDRKQVACVRVSVSVIG